MATDESNGRDPSGNPNTITDVEATNVDVRPDHASNAVPLEVTDQSPLRFGVDGQGACEPPVSVPSDGREASTPNGKARAPRSPAPGVRLSSWAQS